LGTDRHARRAQEGQLQGGSSLGYRSSFVLNAQLEMHDRMPVLLMLSQFERWLSSEMDADELKSAPDDYLQSWCVSKRVNSTKADKDDPFLIKEIEPMAL
jgi:hypothetical protein